VTEVIVHTVLERALGPILKSFTLVKSIEELNPGGLLSRGAIDHLLEPM